MTYRLNELPVPDSVTQAIQKADNAYARWQEREEHRPRYPNQGDQQLRHLVAQLRRLVDVTRRLVVVLEREGVESPEVDAVRAALKGLATTTEADAET